MRCFLTTVFTLLLFISCSLAWAAPRWYWEDRFSSQEKRDLIQWVEHTQQGMERLLGILPFDYRVHFYRRHSAGEPVPWANTDKGRGRAVNFHVDMGFDPDEFHEDWTAPHELIHLIFPYLGEDSRWFAEGIASYLQYQVMYANGELDWPTAIQRYRNRFRRAASNLRPSSESIVDLSRAPRGTGSYVRLYWGGATYFLHADQRLYEKTGKRLVDVVNDYMDCCYQAWGINAEGMIEHFDRLSRTKVFSETYNDTVNHAGFPETRQPLIWLRDHPPQLYEAIG